MQKWEYCAIHYMSLTDPSAAFVHKLTDKGAELTAEVRTILKGLPKGSKLNTWDVVAQIIAQLGAEGWEMVGAGGSDYDLYFKRPKL